MFCQNKKSTLGTSGSVWSLFQKLSVGPILIQGEKKSVVGQQPLWLDKAPAAPNLPRKPWLHPPAMGLAHPVKNPENNLGQK